MAANKIPVGLLDARYTKSGIIYDVREYGAVGDGVVDDTAAIQAAIDAAKGYSSPGRAFFPEGNYYISSPIVIDRRIELEGVGFGSQIFQSTDDNLFEFEPYLPGSTYGSRISNFYLGSAATSLGTSLIYLHKTGNCVIENIVMAGAYYGIHLHGSLFNTIRDCSGAGVGFFESYSITQIQMYLQPDGDSHCNGNIFINNSLGYGLYGLYVDETTEGNFHWYGGRIEQASTYGIYVGHAHRWSIENIHLEGGVACGITIEGCTNARITGDNYGHLVIKSSKRITVGNGNYRTLNVDKWSRDIVIENTLASGATVIESSTTDTSHMAITAGDYLMLAGKSTRSIRNLVDGDLEVWAGGAPLGFAGIETDGSVAEETTIVKFGSKSAKLQIDPGGAGHAYLRYTIDLDRYLKLDLTNYRSSAYKWTESGSGTKEFYVELAAGGDPDIRGEPEYVSGNGGVLIDDTWETKGTLGSLAATEWGYGDNDSLGYSTLYVRLSDDADPDGKAVGFVQARYRVHPITVSCWAYKPETNGANPQLTYYSGAPWSGDGLEYSIPTDEWTRIARTFLPASGKTVGYIIIGFYPGDADDVCYIDGIEIVDGGAASPIYDDSRGLDSDFRVGGRLLTSAFVAFVADDTTPDVSGGSNFYTANANPRTITMFDGGVETQEIFVKISDNNTTIDFTGTNLKGNGGVDWSPVSGDHLRCRFDGTDWWCDVSDNTP